jgi:PKD repeat protein
MNNLLVLLLLISLSIFSPFAQQEHNGIPCGTDEMLYELYHDNPGLQQGIKNAAEELEAFTANYSQSPQSRSGTPCIIPVVFHVIHDYGNGNIDASQIYDAVNQVNIQLRKNNPDTTDIVPSFENIAADTEIEIRLAQLDPNGDCTNGITRTASALTNIGAHEVKSIIQWPPDQYLNIYVCNQAAGLAGHALLPSAADTIPEWDGIVMQHSYIGTIGTSSFFRRTVLTHEIGHYLNLQHIWGGNNVPGYYYLPVNSSANCGFDDQVGDTPETIGWSTCNLSSNSCSSLDNVQNYMDYAYCARMFTEGQKLRMHAALNSTVANRNNLWSQSNLEATGVKGDTAYLCNAAINSSKQIICQGETVEFSDVSYHGITSRNWTFEGGDITNSTDSVVAVQYNSPGTYDVSLQASNGLNNVSTSKLDYITVMPSPGTSTGLIESFETPSVVEGRWVVQYEDNPVKWQLANVGYNSSNSFTVDNLNAISGVNYAFHSTPFDASQMNEVVIFFDYAFARTSLNNTDKLKVQISSDCGETWATRKSLSANTNLYTTNDTLPNNTFVPTNEEWLETNLSVTSQNYLVDDLLIRFLFESDKGNSVYVDNIRISSDLTVGNSEFSDSQFNLYPNPAQHEINVDFGSEMSEGYLIIYDAVGSVVKKVNVQHKKELKIRTEDLPAGLYTLIFYSKNGKPTTGKLSIR